MKYATSKKYLINIILNSFWHKKITVIGKYIYQSLNKRFKLDIEIIYFMKEMYVEDLYEKKEVKEVSPKLLVSYC